MQLPCPSPVLEVLSIDRDSFDERVRRAGTPVVIRNLAADWPIVSAAAASDEEFARYCVGSRPSSKVPVVLAKPEADGRFFYSDDLMSFNFERREVALDFFFDRLINHEKPAPHPNAVALQSTLISDLLPGFAAANSMPLLDASVEPRIWIGNRIRVAPHYDLAENIAVVVAGRRRFTLFPPDQISNLYTGPLETTPRARR